MRSIFPAALSVLLFLAALPGCSNQDETNGNPSPSTPTSSAGQGDAVAVGGQRISPGAAPRHRTADPAALDLSYVTADFFAAVILRPQQIAHSAMLSPLLHDEVVAYQIRQMGFDPLQLEQLILLFPTPAPTGRPPGATDAVSAIGRFAAPTDGKRLLREVRRNLLGDVEGDLLEQTCAGKTYYKLHADVPFAAYLPDDRTMVAADESTLLRMLTAGRADSPLIRRLRGVNPEHDAVVVAVLEPIRRMLGDGLKTLRTRIPPSASALTALAEHVKAATMTVSLSADTPLGVLLEGNDAQSAAKAEELLREGKDLAVAAFAIWRRQFTRDAPAEDNPAIELARRALAGVRVTRNASQVVLTLDRPRDMDTLLPRVAAQAAAASRRSVRQAQRVQSLRPLALAMMVYHQSRGEFPPATIRDGQGRPLLSWRVALLPHLGEQALYDSFRLNEPWDSPHNLAALQRMPAVFDSPDRPHDGKTSIMLIVGDETAYAGGRRPRLAEITDGLSKTIMFVEAGPDKAVPWTKPEDLPFLPADPAAALGQLPDASFLAAFFDTSISPVPASLDVETLRRLIRPRDGQPVNVARRP